MSSDKTPKAIQRAVMADTERPCLYGVAGPCFHPRCLNAHYETLKSKPSCNMSNKKMITTESLFIGGSHDGEYRDVEPPMEYIQLPVIEEPQSADVSLGQEVCDKVMMLEVYKRETLSSHDRRYFVYVLATDDKINLIERLIQGYNKTGGSQ